MFDLETGKLEKTVKTGLYDITAILVDPKTGDIFVADFAWANPKNGGLYLVDLGQDEAVAKCASLMHPTAMCFSADGDIVVACSGGSDDGDVVPANRGRLLMLTRSE